MEDALVLCYHAVSESWPAPLAVKPEVLRGQLSWLLRRGYRGATFSDVVGGRASGRTVAVTFDDGYGSVFERARPILASLELPGTVFVPTAFPAGGAPLRWPGIEHWLDGEFASELRPMTWDQLGALADEGWEIGSHTRSHSRLTELDGDALHAELADSRRDCERWLGRACLALAYPYGAHDARVRGAARATGYAAAATLSRRLHPPGPLSWPRVWVCNLDGPRRFALKVSPASRRVRASIAWSLVERADGWRSSRQPAA